MASVESLKQIIEFNSSFKTAINLYLSLNKAEKVLGYIPTKSSVSFMGDYLRSILDNKEQATLMVGPYGKGKSHLLLVLLAVLSMERNHDNDKVVRQLIRKIKGVDEIGKTVADQVKEVWDKNRYLPVLITDTTGDLNQAFLYGLNDALKRDGLEDLIPNTYYSIALERIEDWNKNYRETYTIFEKEIVLKGTSMSALIADLKLFSKEALNLFKTINSMNNKLINGRIKDKESEKIRIDYLKTYVNACNCFINLVNKGQVNVKYDKKVLTDFINLEDTLFKDD